MIDLSEFPLPAIAIQNVTGNMVEGWHKRKRILDSKTWYRLPASPDDFTWAANAQIWAHQHAKDQFLIDYDSIHFKSDEDFVLAQLSL